MWHGLEGIGCGWLGLGVLHMVLFWGTGAPLERIVMLEQAA